MANAGQHHVVPRWEKITAFVMGTAFLIALLTIAVVLRNPTPFQIYIFRVVLALAGGAFAALIPGFIETRVSLPQKLIIRAGGGLAVFLLIFWFNPPALIHGPASPSVRIHDIVQFRVWKGYTDTEGREISRRDRFEGPVGVIMTPIVSNETTPAQSIFVKNVELEISFDGGTMAFIPKYVTNIHRERDKNEWLAIEEVFVGLSVAGGDSWREDLAFKGDDSISYVDFIESVESQHVLTLNLTLNYGDGQVISATCQVSGIEFKEDIEDAIKDFGDLPSYSQLTCHHEEMKQ